MSTPKIEVLTPATNWPDVLKYQLALLSDYHEKAKQAGNARAVNLIVSQAYDIAMPYIMQAGPRGRIVMPDMLDWYFDGQELSAWYIIRNLALPLYPHFPVLGYYISFADPFRRLAIEIEPLPGCWAGDQEQARIARQNEAFLAHGWQLVRIPYEVATTDYNDILPKHLHDTEVNGYESDEQHAERRSWDAELARRTMRGFFDNLKRNGCYSPEKLRAAIQERNLQTARA